jgi:hypothetical protein
VLIHGGEKKRRPGKKLLPVCARKYRRGACHGDDEVRRSMTGETRPDVVDHGIFGRADKPRGTHDDLDDVYGAPSALVQTDAEVAGELINNQNPAVERLQHQNLLDRGLTFA